MKRDLQEIEHFRPAGPSGASTGLQSRNRPDNSQEMETTGADAPPAFVDIGNCDTLAELNFAGAISVLTSGNL